MKQPINQKEIDHISNEMIIKWVPLMEFLIATATCLFFGITAYTKVKELGEYGMPVIIIVVLVWLYFLVSFIRKMAKAKRR